MNNKAIVVYIDDTEVNFIEFSWLYKTYMLWEIYNEFDLVCYVNPTAVKHLSDYDKIIIKELEPLNKSGSFWQGYGFVNSFAMFNDLDEANWIIDNYKYILKTDCDVFLTKNILGYEPDITLIGSGGYMNRKSDEIIENLNRIRKKLNLNDNKLTHVGASIFGKTTRLVSIIRNHFVLTEYILKTEFTQSTGDWPGWYMGVASMYAIDLSVNHHLSYQHVKMYTLDSFCWQNKIEKNTIHIHAWHGNNYFSKHKFFKGEYDEFITDEVPSIAGEYCHWIASNDLVELKKITTNEKRSSN